MSESSVRVFAESSAVRPAYVGKPNEYVIAESSDRGSVCVDFHLREDVTVVAQRWEAQPDQGIPERWVSVRFDSDHAPVVLYARVQEVEQLVALRDACNAALRFLRKGGA
jgi:hypothetical protein